MAMRNPKMLLPILFGVAVIALTSQFAQVPASPSWAAKNVEIDTIAHLLLYFFLGLLVARYVLTSFNAGAVGVLVLAAGVCTLIGVLDEFHQSYVPGRSAEIRDVVADIAGSLVGAAAFLAMVSLKGWLREAVLLSRAELAGNVNKIAVTALIVAVMIVPALLYAPVITPAANAALTFAKDWSKGAVADALGLEVPRKAAEVPGDEQARSYGRLQGSEGVATRTKPPALAAKPVVTNISDLEEGLRRELIQDLKKELAKELTKASANRDNLDHAKISAVAALREANDGIAEREFQSGSSDQEISRATTNNATPRSPRFTESARALTPRVRTTELVAVIAHPENAVNELSVEDVRKLLAGSFNTWEQLGGDDTPVQVVMSRDAAPHLQNLLKVRVSPQAARLFYNSLMIPSVANARGTVGLVVVKTMEQLRLIVSQESVKVLAIKHETGLPAVALSQQSVYGGTYPLSRDSLATRNRAVESTRSVQHAALDDRS